jgi:hypothetical protein
MKKMMEMAGVVMGPGPVGLLPLQVVDSHLGDGDCTQHDGTRIISGFMAVGWCV